MLVNLCLCVSSLACSNSWAIYIVHYWIQFLHRQKCFIKLNLKSISVHCQRHSMQKIQRVVFLSNREVKTGERPWVGKVLKKRCWSLRIIIRGGWWINDPGYYCLNKTNSWRSACSIAGTQICQLALREKIISPVNCLDIKIKRCFFTNQKTPSNFFFF